MDSGESQIQNRKSGIEIRLLSAADVRRALPMRDAIEVMRTAFRALHAGQVTMPVRQAVETAEGVTLFMPAWDAATGGLGQKVVSVFGGNAARGLPTIHALVTLFDAAMGQPRAVLEGTTLTALRTGAVTGLATDLLARPDARVLTVFGAGASAPAQIEAVCAVRPIETVHVVSRSESAGRLASHLAGTDPTRRYHATDDREAAVRAADVIVAVTTSATPVFDGAWVKAGTHVNGVGSFRPDMQEVDATLLRRAHVVVDQRAAALEEAGDLLVPMAAGVWDVDELYAELGALAAGAVAPPGDDGAITFFKSCGLAIEDVAAAQAVLRVAEREGLGQVVAL